MASLHADVLFTIFMMNATDESECKSFRLNTTRRCSQVCRTWRGVLLDSSLIWGRVLLISENIWHEWSLEVFKRTGSSPLCVEAILGDLNLTQASVGENLSYCFHLLFNIILFRSWERLESLDMTFIGGLERFQPYLNWRFLLRPAPVLRSCIVRHRTSPMRRMEPVLLGPLFSKTAPVLHTFNSNIIRVPTHVPKLRNLTVHKYASIFELLHTLKVHPRLERLTIYRSGTSGPIMPDVDPFPRVDLPVLNTLTIEATPYAFIPLLDQISIPAALHSIDCTLFVTEAFPDFVVDQLREPIGRIFQCHIESVSRTSTLQQIGIAVTNHAFEFFSGTSFSLKASQPWHNFDINHAINLMVALRVPALKDVTYLSLRVGTTIFPKIYPSLRTMLSFMSAVTHIDVLEPIFTSWIGTNYHADVDGPILFPNLHTIYVDRIMVFAEEPQPRDARNLVRFLRRRVSHGHPVSVVHIHAKPASVEKLWGLFSDIVGLRITWNDFAADGKFVGHTLHCKRK